MLLTWVLKTQLYKSFLTRSVSEIRTWLGDSHLVKMVIVNEKLPRANDISLFLSL